MHEHNNATWTSFIMFAGTQNYRLHYASMLDIIYCHVIRLHAKSLNAPLCCRRAVGVPSQTARSKAETGGRKALSAEFQGETASSARVSLFAHHTHRQSVSLFIFPLTTILALACCRSLYPAALYFLVDTWRERLCKEKKNSILALTMHDPPLADQYCLAVYFHLPAVVVSGRRRSPDAVSAFTTMIVLYTVYIPYHSQLLLPSDSELIIDNYRIQRDIVITCTECYMDTFF